MFAAKVLGWSFSPKGYAGTSDNPIPVELEVAIPGHDETLRPDFAVREMEPQVGAPAWQLLVRELAPGEDIDRVVRKGGGLEASPHGRMERLLRQTGVSAGLLFNGRVVRLVSAPRGESSGWVDFNVSDMVQTAGRPISTALRLLLNEQRLLAMRRQERLAALLSDSRKFQNEVSERLAEQVLHALYELLRGFQAANDASKGELLRETLGEHPDEVYRALLTVILRLVFVLYAEERDMLPEDEAFLRYYSIAGLHERLREDAALFPDTMDQRFGAWPQLLVLFRMIFDGAESGPMRLPQRHGVLFDPNRFPFLEGRPAAGGRQIHERIEPPLVPDGTIYRALEKLLVLDGERISYRALDVEEIGSVYQGMMGFRLETATGRSVAVKAQKKWSAPTTVDLDALLAVKPTERKKWLEERTERRFTETVLGPVKDAKKIDDLHAALLARPGRRCDARRRPTWRNGPPAERGAEAVRVALHAARPDRTHRADHAGARPRAPPGPERGGAQRPSRSSTSRCATRPWVPARFWWRLAGSWAMRSSRPGAPTVACRRFRPTRTNSSTLGESLPSVASTVWTGTPSPWTSPRYRCGSRRSRRTIR